MKRLLSLSLVVLIGASNSIAAERCGDVFQDSVQERMAALHHDLQLAIEHFKMINLETLNGTQAPKWADFQLLGQLVGQLRAINKDIKKSGLENELDAVAQQLRHDLSAMGLERYGEGLKSGTHSKDYKPTEYELKLLYQFQIGKLNRELPKDLRIPLQRLPLDARRAKIEKDARNFIAKFEKKFDARFPTTGFKDYDAYVAHLKASEDPHVQKAVEMIEKGQIQIVMRRPENARFWIPKVGFHNQYVTGSSKGTLSPDRRRQAESRLYELHDGTETAEAVADYSKLDPELAPKYATIWATKDAHLTNSLTNSAHYGSDFYTLKLSSIEKRTTFTAADSLGHGWAYGAIEKWDATFVPWKYRLLMVGPMLSGIRNGEFGSPSGNPITPSSLYPSRYWETQTVGSIRLSDVEAFTFMQNEPQGNFLLELLRHEIKIFDGRKAQPGTLWTPAPEQIRKAQRDTNP